MKTEKSRRVFRIASGVCGPLNLTKSLPAIMQYSHIQHYKNYNCTPTYDRHLETPLYSILFARNSGRTYLETQGYNVFAFVQLFFGEITRVVFRFLWAESRDRVVVYSILNLKRGDNRM